MVHGIEFWKEEWQRDTSIKKKGRETRSAASANRNSLMTAQPSMHTCTFIHSIGCMASIFYAVPRAREALFSVFSSRIIRYPNRNLTSLPTRRIPYRHCCCSNKLVVSVTKQGQQIRSPDIVAREYADLDLSDKISEDLGHIRIRQHVNPLRASLSIPAEIPDWNEVFKDPTLPLMVDIGSGSGRFLMWLAKRNPNSKNFLGLEIRPKLVKRAEFWVNELSLSNIHFIFANATVSFQQLVSTYPGPLNLVSILCPDPHFKKKYHKRRVVQKPLVDSIVHNLVPGGQAFIQSDVLEVALDMRDRFDAASDELPHIDNINPNVLCDNEGWLLSNPMGIRTEREIHAELEGAKIYRRLYQKQM